MTPRATGEGEARALLPGGSAESTHYSSSLGGGEDGAGRSIGGGEDARDVRRRGGVTSAILCAIASAAAVGGLYRRRSASRDAPSRLPVLQQVAERQFDGAYSTVTNEPLSYKSPAELGVPVYENRPEFSRPG